MTDIPTLLPVVAVALLRGDGQVLMQKRPAHREHGGLWEFPGGKVEPGETPKAALIREITEELGLTLAAEALTPLGFAADEAPPAGTTRRPVVILLYTCRTWQGEPTCLDAEALGWFAPDALASLPMPPLDIPLAAMMKKLN